MVQRLFFIVAFFFLMSGCATVADQDAHKVLGAELTKQYIGLHEQYQNLEQNLPESKLPQLQRYAGLMDKTKYLLIDYLELVAEDEGDSQEARDKREFIQEMIVTLMEKISVIALEYWEDSEKGGEVNGTQ